MDGILNVRQDMLVFVPKIYPTTQAKQAGFKWNPSLRAWTAPFEPSRVHEIRKLFNVQVLPAVEEKLRQVTEPKTLPAEEVLKISDQLLPHQVEAVSWLASKSRAMLALAPGLGKTFVAIAAARVAKFDRVLVVAPLSLLQNWKSEVQRWFPDATVTVYHRDLSGLVNDENLANFSVMNYDTAKKLASMEKIPAFDLLILDETILIKNRKAQRTKAMQKLASRISNCWELTGAPTSRYLDDMFGQLQLLNPKRFSSYWKFAEKYCHVQQSQWGWEIVGNKPGAIEQIAQDLEDIYYARPQSVLDLPPWIFQDIPVSLSGAQWRLYKEMEDTFVLSLQESDLSKVLAPNVLAQMTRLIQLASDPSLVSEEIEDWQGKAPAKFKILQDVLEWAPGPYIVWASFIKTAEKLEKALAGKYKVAKLTGDTPEQVRSEIVAKFQAGELDVLIAHPAVGKFGFTLTKAKTAIYLERSFNGDDYYQSLHRIRRIGTTESPLVIHLIATGPDGQPTVDHAIAGALRYRTDNSFRLTGEVVLKELGQSSKKTRKD